MLAVALAVAAVTATACTSVNDQPTAAASPSSDPAAEVCAAATEESLLAALKSSPDFYRRVAHPTGLGHIQCSAPFALGFTVGTVQGSGVLFRRDDDRWTVLDIGSAMDCAKYGVTAEDALEGCVV